jgi:uncharacterized membrane-anchored protein
MVTLEYKIARVINELVMEKLFIEARSKNKYLSKEQRKKARIEKKIYEKILTLIDEEGIRKDINW